MPLSKSIPPDGWRDSLTAHALAFSFLSKAFYERPSQELVDMVSAEGLFDDWPLAGEDESTQAGVALLKAYCESLSGSELPTLMKDYNSLFVGPKHLLAAPWESVYLSRERLIFEEPTFAVRRLYADYGLQAAQLNREPDDHFGLEMAFIAHLCTVGLTALAEKDEAGLDDCLEDLYAFLKEHPARWAPAFLNLVIANANTDFYRGVAHLAQGALGSISRLVGPARESEELP